MLNKFHGYSGKETSLGIDFNEKQSCESVYEMECVLHYVDSGEERRYSVVAQVSNGDIPRNSAGRPQVKMVQLVAPGTAGESRAYHCRTCVASGRAT
jgi:hypothetical protein